MVSLLIGCAISFITPLEMKYEVIFRMQPKNFDNSEFVARIIFIFQFFAFFCRRRDDRFSLHKNLILAFILYILTLFIYYYGKLEEDLSRKACSILLCLHYHPKNVTNLERAF